MSEKVFAVKQPEMVGEDGRGFTPYNVTRKGEVRGFIRRYPNLGRGARSTFVAFNRAGERLEGQHGTLEAAKDAVAASWERNPRTPGRRMLLGLA